MGWDWLFGSDEDQKSINEGMPNPRMQARDRLSMQLAGAAQGAMQGRGLGGALSGAMGGWHAGSGAYRKQQVEDAQARIARMKGAMPVWTQLPDSYIKGVIAMGGDPSKITPQMLGLPAGYGGATGASLPSPVATTPSAGGGSGGSATAPVRVKSMDEASKLPKGTRFVAPNGKEYVA